MKKIVVDCERNDPVDIKCGGPYILGYDFFVEDNNVDEVKEFIKIKLKEYRQPLMGISVIDVNYDCKVWDKEMIEKCIKNGY